MAAPLLEAKDVSFQYPDDKKPTVAETSLELRRGAVVGLFGVNACGKTTLARCLCDRLQPATGSVTCSAEASTSSSPSGGGGGGETGGSGRGAAYMTAATVGLVLAVAGAAVWPKLPRELRRPLERQALQIGWEAAAAAAACAVVVLCEMWLWCSRSGGGSSSGGAASAAAVSFITSEDAPGTQLPQGATLEATITGNMCSSIVGAAARRAEAIRLMEAGNFQRCDPPPHPLPAHSGKGLSRGRSGTTKRPARLRATRASTSRRACCCASAPADRSI